jgi:hypothetical protein
MVALLEKTSDLLEQKLELGWIPLDARQMIKISPLLGLGHVPPYLSGTAEMSMAGTHFTNNVALATKNAPRLYR